MTKRCAPWRCTRRWWARLAFALAVGAALLPAPGATAQAQSKELIAVLDLRPVGATDVEASAVTDRVREELLRTGRFTLVDRSQMEAVLNEQALQQTGCTEQECAVQVGQLLGVRKIVAGKLTKISPELWQLSALMVDVETAETVRAESIQHKGDFFGLLTAQVPPLAAKLAGSGAQVAVPVPPPAPPPAAPAPEPADGSKRWRVWTGWGLVGLGALVQLSAIGKNDDAQVLADQARANNDTSLYEAAQAKRTEAEDAQGGAFLFTAIGAGLLVWHYYFDKPPAAAADAGPPPLQLALARDGVRAGWTWRW